MPFVLEICAGSIESAFEAQKGGADRIELCDNLLIGGTSPSFGMVSVCKKLIHIPIFPIIRPRGGDFVYSDAEFEAMKVDVLCCKNLGCEGVVIGILRQDSSIDMERCAELISIARPMQISFHRAFDRCSDLQKGLEDIITLGCERLLTSGGAMQAIDAIQRIKSLVLQSANRISIMPGSGITEKNILQILNETGANEFHSTAKKRVELMPDPIGQIDKTPTFSYETSSEIVSQMKALLH